MSKHIELVKKWLADPESVSLQALKDNAADAEYAAVAAASAAHAAASADASAHAASASAAAVCKRWVSKFEELTNEKAR